MNKRKIDLYRKERNWETVVELIKVSNLSSSIVDKEKLCISFAFDVDESKNIKRRKVKND